MKYIIGIDAGTNSVGWTLNKENEKNQVELIDIGSYIFPIGTNVDPTSNAEKTKNEQRREYRGTKRNLFRYKLRRKKLKALLKSLGMQPDFSKLHKAKKKYQSVELYKLRADAINKKNNIPLEEIGRIFILLNKYRGFLSNAKKQILEDDDKKNDDKKKKEENKKVQDGIDDLVKLIDNAKAKTIGEYFYLMHKKAKELYDVGKWHNLNELIDERAWNEETKEIILYNSRGIRRQFGRYTAREMYQNEFDLIWKTQKQFYDITHPHIFTGSAEEYNKIKTTFEDKFKELKEFKGSADEKERIKKLIFEEKNKEIKKFKEETNYWKIRNYCIYYQRPLRSQKKYLSNCQFEKNKKVIPASSPLFQEFRIWKNLADLRYNCEEDNIIDQPLPFEWKKIIAEHLQTNSKIYIAKAKGGKKNDNTYLIDLLIKINDELQIKVKPTTIFKTEDEESEKYIKGNLTFTAFYEALGENKFNELKQQNKLEQLWHHIYMAKDDEWLKDTLLSKWNFDEDITKHEEIVNKLCFFELENDYGSYCAKTIKAILPYMKNGVDETSAIEFAIEECKIKERKTEKSNRDKITQLKYQELRNPVVEKSVSQVIKIVNAILEKYKNEIDREKLEIRIESTRQLKKPRQQREKMLRDIRKKDSQRQEYADFLNKKKEEGKLNFNRKIYKNDSIVNKFELWLEMGMDKEDSNFSEFEKNTKKGDLERHRLWLECNRICPYTGRIISLTKLFSSEIEIEHIIPLSRSLDDSFNNKTLTFSSINHEKGNRTAFEFMKEDLDTFKKRIKYLEKQNESKYEQFLRQDIKKEFTNDQIGNAGYIAKYVNKKMMEICRKKNVMFTNGSATAKLRRHDWKLSNLLDKIGYEEEYGVDDIDFYLQNLKSFRKDFISWYKERESSTDVKVNFKAIAPEIIAEYENETKNNLSECIEKVNLFDEFRSKDGKKDRSDHRHHAIDSFIIACCSRSISQRLSTYNKEREEQGIAEYDEYGNITRELIERPFDYEQLKQKIKNILVCHNVNQKLISSRKNKHKTSNGIKVQKTFAPQGSLHKDGIYSKLKNPELQGINRKDAFVKRIPLFSKIGTTKIVAFSSVSDLDKVYDLNVRKILEKRIEKYGTGEKAFSKEALEKDPLYLYSVNKFPNGSSESKKGKTLPVIKNIRVRYKNSRNLIQLKAKDENENIVNENRYAETEGNYVIALYELKEKDKKGKIKIIRDFRLLSFFEAVNKKRKGEKLFEDVVEKKDKYLPLMKDCHWLKQGDIVILYENQPDEINWSNHNELKERLYVAKGLDSGIPNKKYPDSEYGYINLCKHNKTGRNVSFKNKEFKLKENEAFLRNSHVQINAVKVRLNPLGIIEKVEEECFETNVPVM